MAKIFIPVAEIKRVKSAIQNKDSLYTIIKVEIKKHRDIQLTLEHEGQIYREEYKHSQELIKYLQKLFNGINR